MLSGALALIQFLSDLYCMQAGVWARVFVPEGLGHGARGPGLGSLGQGAWPWGPGFEDLGEGV